MENMGMISREFWRGKKVFITGHTGFKGGWLALWLTELGAKVSGYSLPPPTDPNFFTAVYLSRRLENHWIGDIRDLKALSEALLKTEPEIVFHLAAQSIVRKGYADPIETYGTNVMGTVNLLEAIRGCQSVKVVILVTSDKCYDNKEWIWPYRETDRLGGSDPYSSSKACAEIIAAAYRKSFLENIVSIATARAGNVIGGGDWAEDRIVPDCIRAFSSGNRVILRSPEASRPWQHVLEPLYGYLILGQKLYSDPEKFVGAWNFGPSHDTRDATVFELASLVAEHYPGAKIIKHESANNPFYEASLLRLDSTKARDLLNWKPRWSLRKAVSETVRWYKAYYSGEDMEAFSIRQITDYLTES